MRIKCAGSLIQHQHPRISRQRARNLHSLALPTAEVTAAFFHRRVIAILAHRNGIMNLRILRGFRDGAFVNRAVPQRKVLPNGIPENEDILIHSGNRIVQNFTRNFVAWFAVKNYLSRPRLIQSAHQLGHR